MSDWLPKKERENKTKQNNTINKPLQEFVTLWHGSSKRREEPSKVLQMRSCRPKQVMFDSIEKNVTSLEGTTTCTVRLEFEGRPSS